MKFIWHGTASVEIVSSSGRVIFDPFVPLKGSNVRVKIEDYDGFQHIFVTHGHFDHIVHIPEIVKRNPSATVYCTATPYQALLGKGVPQTNLRRIEYGQTLNVNGLTLRVYHSRHAVIPKIGLSKALVLLKSPLRGNLPFMIRENKICQENDECVFYQIEAEGKRVSLIGSMNLRDEVVYPTHADLLVLPYNGWEDNFPPAVRIIERLKPQRVLLDHYDDTFPPVTPSPDLSPIINRYPGLVTPMALGNAEEL